MSKVLEFKVKVFFTDEISKEDDIMAVAQNIARAIKREVNYGDGIAPHESSAFTRGVEIKPIPSFGWEVYIETT